MLASDFLDKCGWAGQEEAKKAWGELADSFPVYSDPPPAAIKKMFLYWATRKVLGKDTPNYAQAIGDCVSFMAKNCSEYISCADIVIRNENEVFKAYFSPYFYGTGRVFIGGGRINGDGSIGSWQAKAVEQYGCLEYDAVPGGYSGALARKWGNRPGPSDEYVARGKKNLIRSAKQVTTFEQAANFILNGYPVGICSNVGFEMTPGRDGFHDPGPSWAHAMTLIGVDLEYKEPYGLILNSWGCYDKETEVLTDNGWKKFYDVQDTDLICTLNPKTWDIEYHTPQKQFEYNFNGYLYNFKGRDCDLMVTDNHNMYYSKLNNDKYNINDWDIARADSLPKHWNVKKDGNWCGVEQEYYEFDGYKIKMDLWLEFLGYYLSEGSIYSHKRVLQTTSGTTKNGSSYRVFIAQIKQENRIKMECLFDKLPFKYHQSGKDYVFCNKKLYQELQKFGKCNNKFIPNEILQLSKRQLRILFDALMLGDGTYNKVLNKSGNYSEKAVYYTSSELLANQVQELCLKIGYAADISCVDRRGQVNVNGYKYNHIEYQIGIKRQQLMQHISNKPLLIPYNDKIYCLEVQNHIMYVRRNGKAVWCGNSVHGDLTDFTTDEKLPVGVLRVKASVIDKMLRQDDSFAYSQHDGFPQQKLNLTREDIVLL